MKKVQVGTVFTRNKIPKSSGRVGCIWIFLKGTKYKWPYDFPWRMLKHGSLLRNWEVICLRLTPWSRNFGTPLYGTSRPIVTFGCQCRSVSFRAVLQWIIILRLEKVHFHFEVYTLYEKLSHITTSRPWNLHFRSSRCKINPVSSAFEAKILNAKISWAAWYLPLNC